MMNDKFNEMYLKIIKAKGFEKKGNYNSALKIYLEVIESYSPHDDFAYQRACELLAKKAEYKQAKRVALDALKLIKSDEIQGSPTFFINFIEKLDEKISPEDKGSSNNKKFSLSLNFAKKKRNIIFLSIVLIFFILISIPDKFFKLLFLSFGTLAVILIFEIIQDIMQKLDIKLKSVMFLLSVFVSLFGLYEMPTTIGIISS